MKQHQLPLHFQHIIENAFKLPNTSKSILIDRLDLLKLSITDKAHIKVNLIRVYSVGTMMCIFTMVYQGSAAAFALACLFTTASCIIQRDLEELIDYHWTIDKLREPEIGTYRPAPIGAFWY